MITVNQGALRSALELVCRYGVARLDAPMHAQLITMRGHGDILQLCGTDDSAIACALVSVIQADGDFRAGMWLIDAKKLMGSLQNPDAAVTLVDGSVVLDVTTDNRQDPYVNMGGSDEVALLATVPADAAIVATVDLDALSHVARQASAYRNPYLVIRTGQEVLASLWDEQRMLARWTPVGSGGNEVTFISVDPRYIAKFGGGRARVAWKMMGDIPLWWFDTGSTVLTVTPMAPRFEPWHR